MKDLYYIMAFIKPGSLTNVIFLLKASFSLRKHIALMNLSNVDIYSVAR